MDGECESCGDGESKNAAIKPHPMGKIVANTGGEVYARPWMPAVNNEDYQPQAAIGTKQPASAVQSWQGVPIAGYQGSPSFKAPGADRASVYEYLRARVSQRQAAADSLMNSNSDSTVEFLPQLKIAPWFEPASDSQGNIHDGANGFGLKSEFVGPPALPNINHQEFPLSELAQELRLLGFVPGMAGGPGLIFPPSLPPLLDPIDRLNLLWRLLWQRLGRISKLEGELKGAWYPMELARLRYEHSKRTLLDWLLWAYWLDWYKKLDEELNRAYEEFIAWLGDVVGHISDIFGATGLPQADFDNFLKLLDYLNNIRDFFSKQPGRPGFPKPKQALADLIKAVALYSDLLKAMRDGRQADADRIRAEIAQVILAIGKL